MNRKKVLIGCVIAGIILIVSAYLGIALFYTGGFSFGTWINGIYCTGKSVEEVNAELLSETVYDRITIQYSDEFKEVMTFPEGMVEMDYTEKLQSILMQQNPFLWYQNIVIHQEEGLLGRYTISPSITIHEELLHRKMEQLTGVKAERFRDKSVKLYLDDTEGYVFQNNKVHILDEKLLYDKVYSGIMQQQDVIYAEKLGCYYDEKLTERDTELSHLAEKLFDFLDFTITYQMGEEEEVFDKAVMSHWLQTGENELDFQMDEQGQFIWDMEKVEKAIEHLAEKYDTYGKPHTFQTTGGKTVTLEKGTYGNELDQNAEIAFLTQAVQDRISQRHEPEYIHKAWAQGVNDIGNTYVEVDMTQQKMYFYQAGVCVIDTPVVTGNMMRNRGTPEGVYYIYLKQKNRVLKGPGYAAHVDFWMPVKNGIGIHDAVWRDEFGGEIYKTEGSHGCINTPHDVMEELYEITEIGMPVILFY